MKNLITILAIALLSTSCKKSTNETPTVQSAAKVIGLEFGHTYFAFIYKDYAVIMDSITFHENGTITEKAYYSMQGYYTGLDTTRMSYVSNSSCKGNEAIQINIKTGYHGQYIPQCMQFDSTKVAFIGCFTSGDVFTHNNTPTFGIQFPNYEGAPCYAILQY